MQDIEADLRRIAEQEEALVFPTFDADQAWQLGTLLRDAAKAAQVSVAIDITIAGQCLFHTVVGGATLDNSNWIRRKRNVALHFQRASYAIGLGLKRAEATLDGKYALADADYAAHGGSFPIRVQGAGMIGTVTVSGLPQRDDHAMVVAALAGLLGRSAEGLAFA